MKIECPICKRLFSPFKPKEHIDKYHSSANDMELVKIRDARRKALGGEKSVKNKHYLLKNTYKHDGSPPMQGGLPSLGKKR